MYSSVTVCRVLVIMQYTYTYIQGIVCKDRVHRLTYKMFVNGGSAWGDPGVCQ